MDAEAAPPRSIATHARAALGALHGAWRQAARMALDIALPTLCVCCREPVDGEGLCAGCWSKLSFIAPPYCPRLGIPFVDRKSTRLNSSHVAISYAVFC